MYAGISVKKKKKRKKIHFFRSIDRRRHFHFPPLSFSSLPLSRAAKKLFEEALVAGGALRTSRGSITDDGSEPKSSSPTHASNPFSRTRLAARRDASGHPCCASILYFFPMKGGNGVGPGEEKETAESFEETRSLKSCLKEEATLPPSLLLSPFSPY